MTAYLPTKLCAHPDCTETINPRQRSNTCYQHRCKGYCNCLACTKRAERKDQPKWDAENPRPITLPTAPWEM